MEVLSTTRASSGNGITTTDQSGEKGYNTKFSSTDFADRAYTRDFGGTSAATPIAAGVFGLILSVYPDLDRQSAYDIVTSTASKIRPTEAQYNSKGFSEKYGYGRIDAAAAVQRALEQAALSGKPIGPGAKVIKP
jgi:subtilisin family serine protease